MVLTGAMQLSKTPGIPTGKQHVSRPSLRTLQLLCHASRGPCQEPGPNVALLALKAAMVATAVQTLTARPAFASGWHARRHHRTLQDKYYTYEQEAQSIKVVAKQEAPKPAAPQGLWHDMQRSVRRAYNQARRAVRGDAVFEARMDAPASRPYYGSSYSRASEGNILGWVFLLGAVAAGLFLAFGRNFRWPWSGRRRGSEGGRWVYDRSLGGKMVFVPEAEKPTRSLFGDDLPSTATSAASAEAAATDFSEKLASSFAGAAGTAGSSSTAVGNGGGKAAVLPEWWVPPNTAVYCSPSRREELLKQAKAALRELEDAKLAGYDYPLSTLVALRTLCQEGGGLQVKPRTENGRDAMLRMAVQAAMDAAMEGSRVLGDLEPARFVCGLAHDLGVPDARAVALTHAKVAAEARSLLISAEAGFRSGDQAEIMFSVYKLAQLLATFPLPPGAAESELIAGSIQQQTSMEFRRAIFFNFGYLDASRAPILAEMLGFNPELVMPQLLLQIQAAQQAQQLQQRQAEQEIAAQQQQEGDAGSL